MSTQVKSDQTDILVMGTVVGAFGVLGWVKIKTSSTEPDALAKYQAPVLLQVENSWHAYTLEKHAVAGINTLNIKLAGINDRDQALALKGRQVGIERKYLPVLNNEDEFYQADLLNFTVSNPNNEILGIVSGFMETGSTTVLIVTNNNDLRKHLIPFVKTYILNVDLINRQILADWYADY